MITVHTITQNSEIWRKILDSFARKYDCGVRFTIAQGRLDYEGDRDCALEIIKEAKARFGANAN